MTFANCFTSMIDGIHPLVHIYGCVKMYLYLQLELEKQSLYDHDNAHMRNCAHHVKPTHM